jgi:hypothetical protein
MSSKIDTLNNELYIPQLADVGVFDADGGGTCSYMANGSVKPVRLNGARLVFPTEKFIREGNWTDRTAFHPLAEQISEGPSPVLNANKNYMVERLKVTIQELAMALIELAAEPKRHKALTAKASAFLKKVIDADQKTVDTMRKVVKDAVGSAPEKHLITMFLKNKTDDGSLRACHVSFPVMDEAGTDETAEFFGVKMPRKTKDKALLVAVLEYILGDEEERKAYTSGSKDGSAPYYHSLLLSFRKLAERLNGLLELHAPACAHLEGFKFGLGWVPALDNFGEFAKKYGVSVPALPGNTGREEEEDSVYNASGESVGAVEDLPWEETDDERDRRLGRSDRRDSREDRRDSRESRSDQGRSSSNKGSLKDLLGGGSRRDERDDRRGRDRYDDRDDRRDRDYRRDDRDRDRGRGGRRW